MEVIKLKFICSYKLIVDLGNQNLQNALSVEQRLQKTQEDRHDSPN